MLHFIVNESSASGNACRIWNSIKQRLLIRETEFVLHQTVEYTDAYRFSHQIFLEDTAPTIVVIGGDGTLNEVICGINDCSKVTLGYIPSGSSNDFARSIHMPSDPLTILDNILDNKNYRMIDVGLIEYGNGLSKNFLVSTGIGYDAAICHEALNSKIKNNLNRFGLGKYTYAFIAAKQIFATKRHHFTVVLDGKDTVEIDSGYFVTVMNQPYEGGGYMFCPNAICDDGILDICYFHSGFKPAIILPLLMAAKAGHVNKKCVGISSAHTIEIISDSLLAVHADGESCGFQNKIKLSLHKEKIKMLMP